ncbi:MAG TPA: MerR family DNA-binding transcriptional regulator [Microbacteriaceae bacterium]|nr:MerR family DNA-binding transcriptional regulator [Microbacteriaceae bacterium]
MLGRPRRTPSARLIARRPLASPVRALPVSPCRHRTGSTGRSGRALTAVGLRAALSPTWAHGSAQPASAAVALPSVLRYGSTFRCVRVGEVADRAGVNVETLRYYERRGLLPAPSGLRAGIAAATRRRCASCARSRRRRRSASR